jgi:hypothetical protein
MHAQGHLGFCYAQGKGVPLSLTEALVWHRKAAAQGHAGASANAEAARRALRAHRLAQPGTRVVVHSLVAKPALNGLEGAVVAFVEATGRSAVELDGGKGRFEFKQDSLRLALAAAGEWQPPATVANALPAASSATHAPGVRLPAEARDGALPKAAAAAAAAPSAPPYYRIGTVGSPWGAPERAARLAQTTLRRSYHDDVVAPLRALAAQPSPTFAAVPYGTLSVDPSRYPLLALQTPAWDAAAKPSVLVTGGVHGYETSGVHGALLFAGGADAAAFAQQFNVLVCPCVSPWSYEHVERWNASGRDPNRSFGSAGDHGDHGGGAPGATEEAAAVARLVASLGPARQWACHVDLHETTNSDEAEYMPVRWGGGGRGAHAHTHTHTHRS